ncbi:MAG: YDG domain-containing protein [Verrucomicrobiota bacterium]
MAATIASRSLTGVIGSDDVTISGGTANFADKHVGTTKPVTVTGLVLGGADMANYAFAPGDVNTAADITARALTVSATAQNKVYDGNASATVSLSDDRISGDALTISHAAASFDSKNVGMTKLVAVSGISMTGTDSGNYTLANLTAASSADITAASLSAAATVVNKVYDGTTAGTIATRSLTGVIAPDEVTLSGGVASFADKHAGNAKAVAVAGLVLGGADLANYTLASGDASTTADITPASLAASATVDNKVYDGTTAATIVSRSLTGVIGLDDVTVSGGAASFADKQVGVAKPVAVTGLVLGGADMANYTLASGDVNAAADIIVRALIVSATAQNKVYDGNADAAVSLSDDRISGDALTVNHTVASFDNKNVGVTKSVSVSGIGIAGVDAGNYTLANATAVSSANITAASLVASATVNNKVYDGTTAVIIASRTLTGVIGSDDVTLTGGTASFADKHVGTTKPVAVTGLVLGGADLANYTLTLGDVNTAADIAARTLTVSAAAQNKIYDGNANAAVSISDDRISGDVLTISHTAASFDNKHVGPAKPVTVSGIGMTGDDAGNYTLANVTASSSADITAASLTVTVLAQNKVYDGNADATMTLSDNRLSGDVLTVSHTAASFDNKNVGVAKPVSVSGISVTGDNAGNYTLANTTANSSADITAASLTATAIVSSKVYDGTTAATIASRSLTGVIGSDDVTLTGGTASFADKHVGTTKPVAVAGLVLGGADRTNYTLAPGDVNATADISARALTVTAAASNKVYDGNAGAAVVLSDNRISGDVFTIGHTSASFDNKNVGAAKPVSVSGISVAGVDADNYAMTGTTASSSADITAASLTASATVGNKVYDGLMAATIATRSLTGVINPDDVTLTGGSASFADKHVGSGKSVTVTGLVLDGADMANYTLASGDLNTTADITARTLNIVATGVNKAYDATNTATVTLADNRISGDVLTLSYTNAEFASINVAAGIVVNVSGLAIAGADANNYNLPADTAATVADIMARALTVSAVAQNKVYDGNADATVALADDHIAGEDVAVSFTTAAFDNKNVGSAKPVTVSGISMSGAGVDNYTLASTTSSSSADIAPATLAASVTANGKVYDGTTGATIASRSLAGVIGSDDVTLTGGTASFADKTAGTAKPVAVLGLGLGGGDALNYTLASGDVNTMADIAARALTVSAVAQSKVYDGNADATVMLSDDRISGDALTIGHTVAAFDNKHVGTGKPVTVSGISMSGADAGNYALANITAASSADITSVSLAASVTANGKVYDGTTGATIASRSLTGVVGLDDVTLTGGVASFADKQVGEDKVVTITSMTLAGADLANYTLASGNASATADITARSLAVVASASNKVYDGSADATVTLSDDRISGDVLTIGHTVAAFDTKHVGAGKPVTVSGISMSGADAGNYTLASTTAASSADILAASLAGSITANSKVYDGNTTATIASRSLTGVVGLDDVMLTGGVASFADKNVGNGKAVTATGLSLSGTDAFNYNLASTSASTTADITTRTLTVAAAASNKIYDGNANATASLSDDRISGDVLTVSHTAASFDNKNVGAAKPVTVSGISMMGDDAGNYTLANTIAASSADITARMLAVSAAAANKTYDGNVDATVTLSDDRIAGDDLTVNHTAAAFDNKNAGTAKPVSVSGISVAGADAINYSLASATASASANIAARSLTITATAQNKVYDGNTNAVVTLADNRISGDVLTLANTDAGFEDANVGVVKSVSVLGLSVTGTDADNYSLANLSASATADITPVQLTVTAENKSRAYGVANPTFTATFAGFVNSEDNSVIFGSADLATTAETNSPTGTYPITAALGTLSATNYTFSFANGTLTITPYALVVSADNQSRTYGAANPALTGSLVGLHNGDNVTASYATSADASSGVGSYPITVSLADPDGKLVNYSVTTNEGTLTVNAATLIVTADNKTRAYGVANPALTAAISGFVNNEDSGVVSGAAALSTAADEASVVGSHPITAALGTLSAANYTFNFVEGSLEITAATLTPSITANNKVYDGNTSAAITTRSLAGVVGADDVTLEGGTASFADKSAGLGRTVTATGLSLSGAAANNYALASTSASTSADIAPATLAASVTANGKVYDGTTGATIASRSLAGVIGSDDVTLTGGTASFADKTAGTAKPVAVLGLGLGGGDALNYTLASGDVNTMADIAARALTVSAVAQSKVYDGNADATVMLSDDRISGDALTIGHTVAAFDNKHVGTGKPVTVSGISMSGADAGNYALANITAASSADITSVSLAASVTANGKVYDGTTGATIASRSLTGVVGLDDVTLTGGVASFADKQVGEDKVVTITSMTLAGADLANYTLASGNASATADITARSLAVVASASNKVYDGSADATVTLSDDRISGDVLTIGHTVAAFDTKHVGAGKPVTVSGISMSGADAGNYTLASTTAASSADILAASLAGSITANSKVYDGNTTATIASRSLTGVVGLDDVMLTGGVASFADKNVGNGKTVAVTGLTLGGADLANYTLASSALNATADITAASLTGSVTIANKNYDGTVVASIAIRSLTGVIGLDDVTLSGGTAAFNNKNVGVAKPVATSGLSLSGADAVNYTLTSSSANATADIAAIPLTVTADDQSRNHGEVNPVLTGALTGVVAGDNITASYSTTATAASPVGAYEITPALADPDSNLGNYVVTINNGTLTILGLTPATMGAVMQLPDGNMHIVVSGTPGQVYHLQASGDITSNIWSNISTNTANGLGVVEFDDLNATNHTSRFYRVSTP